MKRKYFNIHKADFSVGQGPQKASASWDLLRGYVVASCHILGFDSFCDVYSSVLKQDVQDYLTRGAIALRSPQLYDQKADPFWVATVRQTWSFLKKYPFSAGESKIDKRQVAWEKLQASELRCADTNRRLRETPRGELPPFIHRARKSIADVLGELTPALVMDIIGQRSLHGKGSTVSNHGGRVTPYYKYADLPYTVSKSAYRYALAAISSDRVWMETLERSGRRKTTPVGMWPHGNLSQAQSDWMLISDCVDYAEDDILTFVPKDATTDRSIAYGASLNLFLQLGVNDYVVERFKTFGIDLTDQSRNQQMAFLGSKFWSRDGVSSPNQFSTIDLKAASDTIAYELVKLLLPSDWFAFLDDLRHASGRFEKDGETITVKYERFSSMGNGYTFPLESLIFWAVSKAAQETKGLPVRCDDISVFGDDIIVRRRGADHVIEALQYCGFEVNLDKSFIEGPFKESCGCDYFGGTDVRPIHLTRSVRYDEDLYYLANRCARLILARGPHCGLQAVYDRCVRAIPRDRLRFGSMLNTSDNCLAVPLSSLNRQGIRPYVTDEEREHLTRELRLDRSVLYTSVVNKLPVEVHMSTRVKTFTGSGQTRFLMWTRYHRDDDMRSDMDGIPKKFRDFGWLLTGEDRLHLAAAASGQVTRRGALERRWTVRSVPNWDGIYSRHSLSRHPAWFMDAPL